MSTPSHTTDLMVQPLLCPRSLRVVGAMLPAYDGALAEAPWIETLQRQALNCRGLQVPLVVPSAWWPVLQGSWRRLWQALHDGQPPSLCVLTQMPPPAQRQAQVDGIKEWNWLREQGAVMAWCDLNGANPWRDEDNGHQLRPDVIVLGPAAQALMRRDLDFTPEVRALRERIAALRADGLGVWAGPLIDAAALHRAGQWGCNAVWGSVLMAPMPLAAFARLPLERVEWGGGLGQSCTQSQSSPPTSGQGRP